MSGRSLDDVSGDGVRLAHVTGVGPRLQGRPAVAALEDDVAGLSVAEHASDASDQWHGLVTPPPRAVAGAANRSGRYITRRIAKAPTGHTRLATVGQTTYPAQGLYVRKGEA